MINVHVNRQNFDSDKALVLGKFLVTINHEYNFPGLSQNFVDGVLCQESNTADQKHIL